MFSISPQHRFLDAQLFATSHILPISWTASQEISKTCMGPEDSRASVSCQHVSSAMRAFFQRKNIFFLKFKWQQFQNPTQEETIGKWDSITLCYRWTYFATVYAKTKSFPYTLLVKGSFLTATVSIYLQKLASSGLVTSQLECHRWWELEGQCSNFQGKQKNYRVVAQSWTGHKDANKTQRGGQIVSQSLNMVHILAIVNTADTTDLSSVGILVCFSDPTFQVLLCWSMLIHCWPLPWKKIQKLTSKRKQQHVCPKLTWIGT